MNQCDSQCARGITSQRCSIHASAFARSAGRVPLPVEPERTDEEFRARVQELVGRAHR